MSNDWVQRNRLHYSDFKDVKKLVDQKVKKNLSISLCLPTLNEGETIGNVVNTFKSELMDHYPLIDEMIVIDSGSTDKTCEIAADYGADVYEDKDILPDLKEQFKGKGENLWKALYITNGDIILYIDTDIKNIHEKFGYGMLGPLLMSDNIKFTKAFYDRPLATGSGEIQPVGGGRVTELVIRPLFALFIPELTQFIQPLSGECAGFREIFEKIPFPVGYGIETSMIIDIWKRWSFDIIAQVDLEKRIHRNRDIKALGRMSSAIIKTFLNRMEQLGFLDLQTQLHNNITQYSRGEAGYQQNISEINMQERPPIIELPEYRRKFNITL